MRMESAWSRQWFALLVSGEVVSLGDHGDFEAAEATATDLGLSVVWLIDGLGASQWARTITDARRAHLDELIEKSEPQS